MKSCPCACHARQRRGHTEPCQNVRSIQEARDSGTGKSHMLIALGTEAAMKGYRVRYTLTTKLVNERVADK